MIFGAAIWILWIRGSRVDGGGAVCCLAICIRRDGARHGDSDGGGSDAGRFAGGGIQVWNGAGFPWNFGGISGGRLGSAFSGAVIVWRDGL